MEFVGPAIQFGIPLLLVMIGLFSGSFVEKRHYLSIERREASVRGIEVTNTKRFPTARPIAESRLVAGSAVISVDAFKAMLAGFQSFFGGRVSAYETLVDRARREAVLRLHEEAAGADLILNLRIETSAVGSGDGENVSSVEAFAYATAIRFAKAPVQ